MKRIIGGTLAALILGLLVQGCSTEPSCDDVASLNSKVQEAGSQDFDEGSMNEYVDAQTDLATAEADCASKGESPSY